MGAKITYSPRNTFAPWEPDMNTGIEAASLFYQQLRARNPVAQAHFKSIANLARQGDLEAVRAMRLIQAVMRAPPGARIGQIAQARPTVTPAVLEMLRQMLIQARNAPPSNGQAPPFVEMNPGYQQPTIQARPVPIQAREFFQVANAPLGFTGEGIYEVINPNGLGLYSTPTPVSQPSIEVVPPGRMVHVINYAPFPPSPTGWVQAQTPAPGYLCLSCPDLPGGPWLVRRS